MGIYRQLYGAVEDKVIEYLQVHGQIHGSDVRDFFIEVARGRYTVDDHAEKLLRELVEDGVLVVGHREPTVSQRAFMGTQYSRSGYASTPWGPGTIEHYVYRAAVSRP